MSIADEAVHALQSFSSILVQRAVRVRCAKCEFCMSLPEAGHTQEPSTTPGIYGKAMEMLDYPDTPSLLLFPPK